MQQDKYNHSYTQRIIYSTQFRSLQDKTQLFYPSQKRRVRTRLTHTLEVRTIAHKIGCLLNEKIAAYNASQMQTPGAPTLMPADLELVEAIAYAHDIGHTPFGHVGERTIDAVVSGQDTLGGLNRQIGSPSLVHPNGSPTMRFKHNSNAMRILVDLGIKDWRVIEGALAHTRICYKGDTTRYHSNPYHPFGKAAYNRLAKAIFQKNGLDFAAADKANPPSLTLEGQIVAVSDEIAQRVADLSDAKIKPRYLSNIEKMFKNYLVGKTWPAASKSDPYFRIEWIIFVTMTEDVARNTFDLMQAHPPVQGKCNGIEHPIYKDKVANFSDDMTDINDKLADLVTALLAQSEEVRESDSRARYIIRQLYKAYLNDVSLLPDEFIEAHLTRVADGNTFKNACAGRSAASLKETQEVFEKIRKHDWHIDAQNTDRYHKHILDMKTVNSYFRIIKASHAKLGGGNPDFALLYDAFLLDIGFYIAGMTNTEAFDAYNKLYGHTL